MLVGWQKPVLGTQLIYGHPLVLGLFRAWLMNENSGKIIHELVDGILPTTWNSTVTWTGRGLTFGALGNLRVEVPNFKVGNAFTVASRIYITDRGANWPAVMGNWTGKDADWFVGWDQGNYSTYLDTAAGNYSIDSTVAVTLNQWIDVAYVFDGRFIRIYEDGIEVVTDDNGAYTTMSDEGTSDIEIGSNSADRTWIGFMAHLYFWKNRALKSAEVMSLHIAPYAMFARSSAARHFDTIAVEAKMFLKKCIIICIIKRRYKWALEDF